MRSQPRRPQRWQPAFGASQHQHRRIPIRATRHKQNPAQRPVMYGDPVHALGYRRLFQTRGGHLLISAHQVKFDIPRPKRARRLIPPFA